MSLKRIQVPTGVEFPDDKKIVRVLWPGGNATEVSAFDLRACCPCAQCVDEMTGKRILDPATVDPAITVEEFGPVGRYALRFRFSDGHSTGIYTFEALQKGEFGASDPT